MSERSPAHTVVLLEYDEISRIGLSHLLTQSGSLTMVGEAATLDLGLPLIRDRIPDLVVIRSKFPILDEIEASRQIKAECPTTHILVLAADDRTVFDCLAAGADGYCLLEAPLGRLMHAAESVAHGAGWLDPSVADRVLRGLGTELLDRQEKVASPLTPREMQVVVLLGKGMSSADIAAHMVLSPETVNSHIRHSMEKLGLKNRTALAVLAHMEKVSAKRGGEEPVLVVEDDQVLREIFVRQLQLLGYRCDTAGDGAEAMRQVKQRRYKAIVMDVKLPVVGGLEATRAIREYEQTGGVSRSRIIGITSGFCTHEEAVAAGMDELLEKPISMAMVSNLLRKLGPATDSGSSSNAMNRATELNLRDHFRFGNPGFGFAY
jgi:DNA-binding NarL/FixJ family response regulator